MKAIIIDNTTSYIAQLEELLGATHDTRKISYSKIENTTIDNNDLLILSGGHKYPVLGHEEEYRQEIELIKRHAGPIIGICLGFQLIAHTYGSALYRLDNRRKGLLRMEPITPNNIIGTGTDVFVHESHNWAVRAVKPPLQAIARSNDGVEIFKHTSRPLYGLQFHPESYNSPQGRKIFKNILGELNKYIARF